VRPCGLDHVEIAVTDAARLEADEHLAGARRLDLDLLEAVAADLAQDDAAIQERRSGEARGLPAGSSATPVVPPPELMPQVALPADADDLLDREAVSRGGLEPEPLDQ